MYAIVEQGINTKLKKINASLLTVLKEKKVRKLLSTMFF